MNVALELPVVEEAGDELERLWREPEAPDAGPYARGKLDRVVARLNRTLRELRSVYKELWSANRKLQSAKERLNRECERHKGTRKELRSVNRKLRIATEKLAQSSAALDQERVEKREFKAKSKELDQQLKAALRAVKRHTTPFSRNQPKDEKERKRSGRRSGAEHGRHAHRQVPDHADEVHEAPIVEHCCCGGDVVIDRIAEQWQTEFRAPINRQFLIPVGHCKCCGKRHQGRHPLQTSDALGAAAVTLGPNAQGLLAYANKRCGVSPLSLSRMFGWLGMPITPGGAVQVVARVGRQFAPTFAAMVKSAPHSQVVAMDATGWRIGGRNACLLVWVLDDDVTIFMIVGSHSFAAYAEVIGAEYAGIIERDGAIEFRCFVHATHQTCLNHLLKRCHEMIKATPADSAVPSAARSLFKDALALRDRRDDPKDIIDADEFGLQVRDLEARADSLIQTEVPADEPVKPAGNPGAPDSPRKLLKHLTNERPALLSSRSSRIRTCMPPTLVLSEPCAR